MAYGWEGEMTRLVPLDKEKHFENCLRWINDPEATVGLAMGDNPMTRLAEEDWFERRCREIKGDDIMFAIETLDGEHIGNSGLFAIDYRHGHGTTGTLIGPEAWGKGYGTDAARVRSHYAFNVLGLRMLKSSYFEGNDRSRRMQEKAGYVEIGRWPKGMWKRGMYRDEVLTCLTRETWESMQTEASRIV